MGTRTTRRRERTHDPDDVDVADETAEADVETEQAPVEGNEPMRAPTVDGTAAGAIGTVQRVGADGRGSGVDAAQRYADYEPGSDGVLPRDIAGLDVTRDGEAAKVHRLVDDFGSDRVQRWVDEGMPVETMGKPRDMAAFRERQAARPADVPTDVERRNQASRQRNVAPAPAGGDRAGEAGAPDAVRKVVSSSGTSMDDAVQREMESKMGGDFSEVQLHTGPEAAAAAESINAKAFTVGNHVAFNEGEYDPSSKSGKKVLAHELTHVRQQTDGRVSLLPKEGASHHADAAFGGRGYTVQPKLAVSSPNDPAEKEAEQVAERVVEMDEAAGAAAAETAGTGTAATAVTGTAATATGVSRTGEQVHRIFGAIGSAVESAWNTVTGAAESLYDRAKGALQSALQGARDIGAEAWQFLRTKGNKAWRALREVGPAVWQTLTDYTDQFLAALSENWALLRNVLRRGSYQALQALGNLGDRLGKILTESRAWRFLASMDRHKLVHLLNTGGNLIIRYLTEAKTAALRGLSKLGKRGFALLERAGGAWDAVAGELDRVWHLTAHEAGLLAAMVRDGGEDAWSVLTSLGDEVWNLLNEAGKRAWHALERAGEKFWGYVTDGVGEVTQTGREVLEKAGQLN